MAEDQEFVLPPLEERPLVTFALFAYNQEKYIREAVEGAFAQTYEPLEIILSDDCSTDSTFQIMRQMVTEYQGRHTVRIVRNAANMGVLNHVLARGKEAQGSIIVMAAGDDISFPNRTEKLVDALRRNVNADAVYSLVHIIDQHGKVVAENVVRPVNTSLPPLYLSPAPPPKNIVQGCSAAYKKGLFELYKVPASSFLSEDVLFSFLLNLNQREIIFLEEVLLQYRFHDEAISNCPRNNRKSSLEEEEKNMLEIVDRIGGRIQIFRLIASSQQEKLDQGLIENELHRCKVIQSWNKWSALQRIACIVTEIVLYKGRLAKWQAVRIFGKYPRYQPKAFISKFQRNRYRN